MEIDNENVFKIIQTLEVTRVALAKIGASYPNDPESLSRLLCYFLIDFDFYEKITFSCRILTDAVENDDDLKNRIDDFYDQVKYWDKPNLITDNDLNILIKSKGK